jgi:ribonuclease D
MSPSVKITKEEINALPMRAYEGPVVLVESDDQLEPAIAALRKECVLGFDTETRPSFKRGQVYPAALLQLGAAETVYLFQLLKLEKIDPLWDLLGDPQIIKAGVAIADDIKKLQERQAFQPAGFKEIANYTQAAGILNTGLRSLAGLLLNFRISKRAQVSNWARDDLSEAQIQYAATDAWVSRQLYLHMQELATRATA